MKTYFRILVEHEEFYCNSIQISASGSSVSFQAYFPPIPALLELPANTYAVIQIKNDLFKTSGDGWITAMDGLLKRARRINNPTKNEVMLEFVSPFDWGINIKLLNYNQLNGNIFKELLLRNHNYLDLKSLDMQNEDVKTGLLQIEYIIIRILEEYFGIYESQEEKEPLKKDTLFFSLLTYLSIFQNDLMDLEDAFHLSRRLVFGDPNFLEGEDIAYPADFNYATESTNATKAPILKDRLRSMFTSSILDYIRNLQSETSISELLSIFARNMEHNMYGQLFPKLSFYSSNVKNQYFPDDVKKIRNKYYSDFISLNEDEQRTGIMQYLFIPEPFTYIPPSSNVIFPSQISSVSFEINHTYPTRVATTFAQTNGPISYVSNVSGLYPGPLHQTTYPKLGITLNELYAISSKYNEADINFNKIKALVAPNNLNHRAVGTYFYEEYSYKDVLSYFSANTEGTTEEQTTTPYEVDAETFNDSVATSSRKTYNMNWSKSKVLQVRTDFNPYMANGLPAIVITSSAIYFGQVVSITHNFNSTDSPTTTFVLQNVDQLTYPIDEVKWWLTKDSYYRVNNHEKFYKHLGLTSFGETIYNYLTDFLTKEDTREQAKKFCGVEHKKALEQLGYEYLGEDINVSPNDPDYGKKILRKLKDDDEKKRNQPRINNSFYIIKMIKAFILEFLLPSMYGANSAFKRTEEKNIEIIENVYQSVMEETFYISTQQLKQFMISSNDETKLNEAKQKLEEMSQVTVINKNTFNSLSTDYIKINDFKPIIDTEESLDNILNNFLSDLDKGEEPKETLKMSSIAEVRYFLIKLLKRMIETYTSDLYQQIPIYALNEMNTALWAVYELVEVYQILPVINKIEETGKREIRFVAVTRPAKEILKYMPNSE